jgi:hypothetical protein
MLIFVFYLIREGFNRFERIPNLRKEHAAYLEAVEKILSLSSYGFPLYQLLKKHEPRLSRRHPGETPFERILTDGSPHLPQHHLLLGTRKEGIGM